MRKGLAHFSNWAIFAVQDYKIHGQFDTIWRTYKIETNLRVKVKYFRQFFWCMKDKTKNMMMSRHLDHFTKSLGWNFKELLRNEFRFT